MSTPSLPRPRIVVFANTPAFGGCAPPMQATTLSLPALLLALTACATDGGDTKGTDTGPSATTTEPPTFTEAYVESGVIEALHLRHGAMEVEAAYEETYPVNHPIVLEIRYAHDDVGFSHQLYWGIVNAARTRACVIASEAVSYGGPDVDPTDESARTHILEGAVRDDCFDELMSEGPLHMWVGANRLIRPNEAIAPDSEELVRGVNDLAFLENGNVQIFDSEGTDLSGLGRNQSCLLRDFDIATSTWSELEGSEGCATSVELSASEGTNVLLHDVHPLSSLGVVDTETDDSGTTTCVQQKGRPLFRVTTQLGVFGETPVEEADGSDANALTDPLTMTYRLCVGGEIGDVSCDTSGEWIDLLVNPTADNSRGGIDPTVSAELEDVFSQRDTAGYDDAGMESGDFNDQVTDLAYLEWEPVTAALHLPAAACTSDLLTSIAPSTAAVLEVCAVNPDASLDAAYAGSSDNCRRVAVDVGLERSAVTTTLIDIDEGFSEDLGNSTISLEMSGGMEIYVDSTPIAYAYADFDSDVTGKWDIRLFDAYAEAGADTTNGAYWGYEVSFAGVALASDGDSTGTTITHDLSYPVYGLEKCLEEEVDVGIVDVDVEACTEAGVFLEATFVAGLVSASAPYRYRAYTGVDDAGLTVSAEASFDGGVDATVASASVTASSDPLVEVSVSNDAVFSFYTGNRDYRLALDLNLCTVEYDAVDLYLKVKGCVDYWFGESCDSVTLIDYDGWSDSYTVYDESWSTGGRY